MNRNALRTFEGRQVNVSIRGGTRIDDCQLVSVGRSSVSTVWLFSNGTDVFVPLADVLDVREASFFRRAA